MSTKEKSSAYTYEKEKQVLVYEISKSFCVLLLEVSLVYK